MNRSKPYHVPATLMLLALAAANAHAGEVEGFTEPYRSINVAAVEMGTIVSVEVKEGDSVTKGQPLVSMDNDVLMALLLVAEEDMNTKGRLNSARAELELRTQRLEKLESLRSQGHARQEEVERARADAAIAQAGVLTAQEDLLLKRLEFEKIKVQIARRVVRAPMNGVVSLIHKEEGEFVAPNDPNVLQLVQLDTLLASFSIAADQVGALRVGQTVKVRMLTIVPQTVNGKVHFISPVTDAESGTVRVKIRIENKKGEFRSGERCVLDMPSDEVAQR